MAAPDSSGQRTAKDSAVVELEELRNSSRRIRQRYEPQWHLNMAFYEGDQWVAFDGVKLYEPDVEGAKPVDNRIQGIVRTDIAKMTKAQPTFVGVPRSAQDKAIASARMTERVLDNDWRALDMRRKDRAARLWARVAGAGFLRVYWDATKGSATEVLAAPGPDGRLAALRNPAGAPYRPDQFGELPVDLQEAAKAQRVAMGDVCVDLRSPFQLCQDPLAGEEGLESAEWIIDDSVYSVDHCIRHWQEELEPDAEHTGGINESRMPLPGRSVRAAGGKKTGVRIRELWAKPSSKFPAGRYVVWAPGVEKVLYEGPNPYLDSRGVWLPYVMYSGIPVPGRFWPSSITEQLISPQTELNKLAAQIEDNASRVGNPPLLKPSSIQDWEWLGLPGEVIEYQDTGSEGAVPRFMEMPELPSYVQNRLAAIETSIREISGQHEVTSGSVPAGVTAASAINLLQEQDDTRLGPDIGDTDMALAGLGRRIIWLRARFQSDERLIKLAGDDDEWNFHAFKGELLEGVDVEVQTGSGLPQSKAAKTAAIQEVLSMLAQSNVPLNERDLRRVLQEYQVGGLEKFFATLGEDERQVKRENMRMAAGIDVAVRQKVDNHESHVAGHQSFMKTAAFDELDEAGQARFYAHLDEHLAFLVPPTPGLPPGVPAPPPGMQPASNGGSGPPGALASAPSQPSTAG